MSRGIVVRLARRACLARLARRACLAPGKGEAPAALALTIALVSSVALSGLSCASESSPSSGRSAVTLAISEIMYHPVLETGDTEEHEFVELENYGTAAIDLAGVRLSGGIRFTFATGSQIAPGGFLVVAKRRERLLQVAPYSLSAGQVVGDYSGSLSNDGDTVTIERGSPAAPEIIDRVSYDDAFPWPLGADALGASDAWLPPEVLPLEAHRFMGRSLQRRSSRGPGDSVSNWTASPLDGATPGRAPATAGDPLPTLTAIEVGGRAAVPVGPLVPPGQAVAVRIAIAPDRATDAQIEYFVDDQAKEDEAHTKVALGAAGTARVAMLPPFPEGSLVRYRIWGDRGAGPEVLSPRPEDPQAFYSFYAGTPIAGHTPAYQLLISKARWEKLWDNIIDGRVPGNIAGGNPDQCEVNPTWDARVPAVIVMGGGVYDVQARYQGSRTNRFYGPRGFDRMKWPGPGVAASSVPAHVVSPLSWHFSFPRHARPGGLKTINLSKLVDGACQGFLTTVGDFLFEQAGVPAAHTRYARLYINGSYYHYTQQIEHVDDDLLTRFYGPDFKLGDLFKSVGVRWDEGPFGFGDEGLLQNYCGYSAQERYDATYERQTLKDERPGSAPVQALIEEFQAARATGNAETVRAFFAKNFDVDLLTNYLVVRNWMGAWDDIWQNHFLYRRADGRWLILPTDLDNHFGFSLPSAVDASFFAGMDNGRSNFRDLSNPLKDSFLRVYRAEFLDRLRQLSGTVLHPSNVLPLIDEALAGYDLEEARQAPAGVSMSSVCSGGDPALVAARMKAFAQGRYERVLDGLYD